MVSNLDPKRSAEQFARWKAELDYALKDEKYRKWLDRSERILKRYRDERATASADVGKRKYNILWANVQTLGPAVYGKMPKPIAERRFLDRDPAARLASMILERALAFQMDIGGFHQASNQAVQDYLLPGMGPLWIRYEAAYESDQVAAEDKAVEAKDESADEQADEGFGEVYEKLSYERVCWDHVFYRDYLWSPSRVWCEVPWIAKRCWLDKSESEEQFGEDIANRMIFGDPRQKDLSGINTTDQVVLGRSKKAEVWEFWCKPERKVYFIAPDTPGVLLKEQDDPLHLEGFWPSPEPLFATQTNDTLVPIPDYIEYQDQAQELDDLTDRIDHITTAVRANGVYNSEFPALQRLLQQGQDNKLIPVDQWAAMAEKGGVVGAIQLLPMEEIIRVLETLYDARDRTKAACDELTGLSDILRGVSDPRETASAQKIKSNYATGRLGSRQEKVAFFAANSVRIGAEIIAEIFSDESLVQMSGVDQMFRDQVRNAVEAVPQPQAPQANPSSPQSNPQMQQQMLAQQWEQAKAQAAQAKQAELQQQLQDALRILRSDKLRGFRVDIETDSTIADDLQNDKQAVMEYLNGLFESIKGAEQTLQAAPELVKPLGEAIMFAGRKFRVGRSLEASFEDAFDKLEKRIEDMKNQPPKPDPEMIKAQSQAELAQVKGQAEQAKSQADVQASTLKAQAETARAQADIQVQSIQLQSEQKQAALTSQIEALKIQLQAKTDGDKTFTDRQKAYIDYLKAVRVAEINAGVANDETLIDAQIEATLGFAKIEHEATQNELDRQHEAGLQSSQQTADAQNTDKQVAAKVPKGKKPGLGQQMSAKADQRHEAMLQQTQANHADMANALAQIGQGMNAIAKAQQDSAAAQNRPKRVVFDQSGRPVGVEPA